MLHHVPTAELQDQILQLGELCRVLRPGGILLGSDSLPSDEPDKVQEGDTYVPCDPAELPIRPRAVGFVDVRVDTAEERLSWANSRFRFAARNGWNIGGRWFVRAL